MIISLRPSRLPWQHPNFLYMVIHLFDRWGILTLMKSKVSGNRFVDSEQTLKHSYSYNVPARHPKQTHTLGEDWTCFLSLRTYLLEHEVSAKWVQDVTLEFPPLKETAAFMPWQVPE